MKNITIFAGALLAFGFTLIPGRTALIGLYEFDGNFDNSFGSLGSLSPVTSGGTSGFASGS